MSFQDFAIPELINLVASKCNLYDLEKLECVSKNIKNMTINYYTTQDKIRDFYLTRKFNMEENKELSTGVRISLDKS